jgi:riboflavin synthase
MFTGIIRDVGEIVALDKSGDWKISVSTNLNLDDAGIGCSIACDGVCLTLIEKTESSFTVQLSAETLSKTTAKNWKIGKRLNLERALRMGEELGGHLVSGHVDGVAKIVSKTPENDSLRYKFSLPENLAKYAAQKGSIAVDGISLTVNEVEGEVFGANIIPHTQNMTTLGAKNIGDDVNIEIDVVARYVERMLASR